VRVVSRSRVLSGNPVTEPRGNTVLFQDDFASGAFTNWGSCQWKAGAAAVRNDDCSTYNGTSEYSATVASDGGAHPHAARFEVRDGDSPFLGTERSEIGEPHGAASVVPGDTRWVGWDMKFDSTWPVPVASSGWCAIWQWHPNSSTGSPPICLDIDGDDVIYLANDDGSGYQRTAVQSVQRNVWQRWVIKTYFTDQTTGYASVWVDGVNVLPQHSRRTLVVGDTGAYFKAGVYRDPVNTATAIRWLDNIIITAL
jgi:hypothetical protein